jgi:hypothetical protein
MSLAEQYASARIVGKNPPKILTLDIERLPGWAIVKHRGLTVSGPFWDLGDWKNVIGYRIPVEAVSRWPRNICIAWRWYGQKRVSFAAEWEAGGAEAMHRQAWDLYNEADIVVGHNLDGFDTKKLATEWSVLGLSKPSPFKSIDTLKIARSQFGDESKTLDALLVRRGLRGKVDKYDVRVALAACKGDVKMQRKLKAYNQGDIVATEAFYDYVRGWIPNHPHIGLWSGVDSCCGNCGGDLKASDWCRTTVTAYAQYSCVNCGAWYRRNDIKRRVVTRVAR